MPDAAVAEEGEAADVEAKDSRPPKASKASSPKPMASAAKSGTQTKDKNVFEGLGLVLLNAIKENDFTRALGMIMGGVDLETTDSRGQSALHVACWKGSVGVVRLLLEGKATIDKKDFVYQVTALHVASARGSDLIAKQLIDNKAELNAVGIEGDTPLSRAASRGYVEIVRKLLSAGAATDPDTPPMLEDSSRSVSPCSPKYSVASAKSSGRGRSRSPEYQGKEKRKQMPAISPLLKATKRNAKAEVTKLLVENKAKLNATDPKGNCPLHIAAYHGNPCIVRVLLTKNIDVEMENLQQRVPLHYAARSGDLRVIKMILEFKANVNHEDDGHITPVMCCGDPCGRKMLEKYGARESPHWTPISPPMSPTRSRSNSRSPPRSRSRSQSPRRKNSPSRGRRSGSPTTPRSTSPMRADESVPETEKMLTVREERSVTINPVISETTD